MSDKITLTKREYDIIRLATLTNEEIAFKLGLAPNTVNVLFNNLYTKLNAKCGKHTRVLAVLKAIRLDLISPYNFII